MARTDGMRVGRVLVVDDEPDHCTTVRAILQRSDTEVTVAGTAAEAVAAVTRQRFDVALLDLRLPDRDGLACMRELRQMQQDLQVVILTAYPSPGTCQTALTEGAAAYLEKPCGPETLLALLATLLAGDDPARGLPRTP